MLNSLKQTIISWVQAKTGLTAGSIAGAKAYVSIAAQAKVFQDAPKAKELWRVTDTMWWPGPDDPNVCIVRAELLSGEIWDGPFHKGCRSVRIFKGSSDWSTAESWRKQKDVCAVQ